MTSMISHGIDLAGYSKGTTAVARCIREHEGNITAFVLRNTPLSRKSKGEQRIAAIVANEHAFIHQCLALGNLVVDVPIDLQQLATAGPAVFVWQLTQRPVDRVFGGMPPLADRIGSPVARFAHLLRSMPTHERPVLGESLWETYPAASLSLMGLPHENYKGEVIEFTAAGWFGCTPLCAIANGLGLDAEIGSRINDDEVDAIICAMTGLAGAHEKLLGEELARHVADILTRSMKVATEDAAVLQPARGYVLLKSLPRTPTRIVIQEHALESTF